MEKNIVLRPAKEEDYASIREMHCTNFKHDLEAVLVDNLRKLPTFKDYYSEVLCLKDEVIGHVMLTPVIIQSCKKGVDALIVGPVSISNKHQGKGYGTVMMNECLKMLKEKGHDIILVYGGDYYHRFGFKPAKNVYRPNPMIGHGILMKRLSDSKSPVSGVIHYPHPFDPLINEWKLEVK